MKLIFAVLYVSLNGGPCTAVFLDICYCWRGDVDVFVCDAGLYKKLINKHGISFWTAGQWTLPHKKSPFVWKVESTKNHTCGNLPLTYTNWRQGEPTGFSKEACLTLLGFANFPWNDNPCTRKYVPVCEIQEA